MKASFAFTATILALSLATAGCASKPGDGSGGDSSGNFHGSCTIVGSYTGKKCVEDYHNSVSWMKDDCSDRNTSGTTATYSSEHCPTEGMTGKCELWDWNEFYYDQASRIASLQEWCASGNGTWSTN
jgi:hypothetical protein